MTNQERIKEYLVGEKGYLKSDISNGKVIMLSGVWGSGKTHFWQNKVATDELKEKLKREEKAYSYISLYGKTSIEEIENNIYEQVFYSAVGENIVTKTSSTFTKLMKRYGGLSSIVDFSKIADGLDEEKKDNEERIGLKRLYNGGIICFDDFERKSKEIDLNDLFGFITQLTLNFKCKVVVILNDDVFKGKEKDIFSNVKEKTVSKFLKYEPNIEELFELIFDNMNYKTIANYKNILLDVFKEIKVLNARVYIQVLNNLLEWKVYNNKNSTEEIRYFVLVNINFINYHTIPSIIELRKYDVPRNYDLIPQDANFDSIIMSRSSHSFSQEHYINRLKEGVSGNANIVVPNHYLDIIDDNLNVFKSISFMYRFIRPIKMSVNVEKRTMINNFIETGIFI